VLILGLDTATRATVAALVRVGDGDHGALELEARDDPPPGSRPQHATRLLGLAAEVLDHARLGWEAVDRIAVGIGPGTFTGLRIGVASARALARARDVELVGVSTLQSVALNAAPTAARQDAEAVLAVLDARRGEAFVAGWPTERTGAPAAELISPRACGPEALADVMGGRSTAPQWRSFFERLSTRLARVRDRRISLTRRQSQAAREALPQGMYARPT